MFIISDSPPFVKPFFKKSFVKMRGVRERQRFGGRFLRLGGHAFSKCCNAAFFPRHVTRFRTVFVQMGRYRLRFVAFASAAPVQTSPGEPAVFRGTAYVVVCASGRRVLMLLWVVPNSRKNLRFRFRTRRFHPFSADFHFSERDSPARRSPRPDDRRECPAR